MNHSVFYCMQTLMSVVWDIVEGSLGMTTPSFHTPVIVLWDIMSSPEHTDKDVKVG